MDEKMRSYVRGLTDRAPAASGDLGAVIRRGRRRQTLSRGGAVLAVGAVAVAVFVALPSSIPGSDVAATVPAEADPVPETTVAPTTMPALEVDRDMCGTALPIEIHVPDGYGEGVDGPAAAGRTGDIDQMVVHWQGDETALEVRWPPDPAIWQPADHATTSPTIPVPTDPDIILLPTVKGSSPEGTLTESIAGEPPIAFVDADTALGPTTFAIVGAVGFEPPCNTTQIVFYGAPPVDTDVLPNVNPLLQVIWGRGELVTSTVNIDSPPVAIECGGGDAGFDYPPNKGGPVDLGDSYDTSEEALEAFLFQAEPTLSREGYTKMIHPDGSVSFGYDAGAGYATVVHISQQDGRWTVETWEASGC